MIANITRLGYWEVGNISFKDFHDVNIFLKDPKLLVLYPHFDILNLQFLEGQQIYINQKNIHWVMTFKYWITLREPENLDPTKEEVDNGDSVA
jgi:hypothetical protein